MAITAIIAAGVGIAQGVQALAGGDAKDLERLAKNAEMYARAIAGDRNAALFLKQRTGQYGIVTIPGEGEVGGWKTPNARADAVQKWETLQQTATVQTGLASATSTVVDKVEQITGRKIVALTPTQWAMLALGGVVLVVVATMLFKKKRA